MHKSTRSPSPQPRCIRAPKQRRLLVYAHHDQWGKLADYVLHLIRQVHKLYARIVFISTSPLSPESCALLHGICNAVLLRPDTSSVFPAWKEALCHEGSSHLAEYDSVTLLDSSCIGPFSPLEDSYRCMESQSIDFWGMTYSSAAPRRMKPVSSDTVITPALHSSFLCFHKSAVVSPAFHDFWDLIGEGTPSADSKLEYEALLCNMMQSAGLRSAVLYDSGNSLPKSSDREPAAPEDILERGVPFLQTGAFFSRMPPENAFLLRWIKQNTRYPWKILEQYLRTHFTPETSIRVVDHNLDGKGRYGKSDEQRVGIHIHAFYPDILYRMLREYGHKELLQADIFLTTDSASKAREIRRSLHNNFPNLHICELLVFENRGRDILPWLKIAPLLEHYDFAGHFHTKKRGGVRASIWLEEALDCLLGRLRQIKYAFASNSQLGIVIPDIPSLFKFAGVRTDFFSDVALKDQLTNVWKRLGSRRHLDFFAMRMLVFPYGSMFWYRPAALGPLWRHHWVMGEIPPEPVPNHGTLLHTLERLPVYVAWDQEYDFCIAPPTTTKPMGFQDELALCDYNVQVTKTSRLQFIRMKMKGRFAKV